METVTDYNIRFQKENPQFFTKPTAEVKSTPVISSDAGVATINNAIADHSKDITKLQPTTTTVDTTTKPTVATKNTALEKIGAVTASEANATGMDLTGYVFDNTSNYYVPKANTNAGQLDQQYEKDKAEINSAFTSRLASFDAASRAIVDSIQGIYSARIQEQQDLNKRSLERYGTLGIRGGTGRYAPEIQNSILTGEEREGLKRIKTIAAEEAAAIAKAQQELTDKKYTAFVDSRNQINDLRKERQSQLEKLQEIAAKEQMRIAEANQKEKETLAKYKNDALMELGKSGVTDVNVINGVKNAQDVSEIVKAAGENLIGGTGIIGEYNFYKKDAIRNGLTPLTFDAYQTRDANRKATIASAGIGGTDLNQKDRAVFNQIVGKVTASPAIQALDSANKLRDIVQEIRNNPSDPAQQLNLIYSYIKGLDTNSAVKEGEIELVKSINSYLGKTQLMFEKVASGKPITSAVALQIADSSDTLITSIENIAKKKLAIYDAQAKENGTSVYGAWKSFKSTVEQSQFNLVTEQKDEEKKLLDYVTANPNVSKHAADLAETIDPSTGVKFTPAQILEFLLKSK